MSEPETCPGCDGTITRAIQQGREITTYERCQRCAEREEGLWDHLVRNDAIFVPRPGQSNWPVG